MSTARPVGVPGAEPIEPLASLPGPPWGDCHACGLAVQLDRCGALSEHSAPDSASACDGSGAEPLWLDRVGTVRR